ncbi:hypothetical protein P692DRAFT_20881325 [Suillus brevipes Sb2]|nr:hypothetical protein P692DRAFT_20881325 [Suillus brevipes Sb2]
MADAYCSRWPPSMVLLRSRLTLHLVAGPLEVCAPIRLVAFLRQSRLNHLTQQHATFFSPTAGVASALLLVTPYTPNIATVETTPGCLTDNFYGTYGGQSVFHLPPTCLDTIAIKGLSIQSVSLLPYVANGERQLIWLQESAIDSSLVTPEHKAEVQDFFRWLGEDGYSMGSGQSSGHQHLLSSANEPGVELHLVDLQPAGGSYGLIAVEPSLAPSIEALLPRYWKPYILPNQPTSYLPVPKPAIEHVKSLLETVRFDPVVSSLVNNGSRVKMESPESSLVTRLQRVLV